MKWIYFLLVMLAPVCSSEAICKRVVCQRAHYPVVQRFVLYIMCACSTRELHMCYFLHIYAALTFFPYFVNFLTFNIILSLIVFTI